jgi:hypothetical protein
VAQRGAVDPESSRFSQAKEDSRFRGNDGVDELAA